MKNSKIVKLYLFAENPETVIKYFFQKRSFREQRFIFAFIFELNYVTLPYPVSLSDQINERSLLVTILFFYF